MRRKRDAAHGTVHSLVVDSQVLRTNLLGDHTDRDVAVYMPAGHDGTGLPLLVLLAGFGSGGPAATNWRAFGENLPERLDRLIATGAMPPVAVACPDCFTRLGGNQYINSPAMGRWEDFLVDEVLPAVEGRFGCGDASGDGGRRGVLGFSSGGYGAIVQAMRRPEVWAAAACQSGDMGFEWCYLPDMPALLRALARHDGSIEAYVRHVEGKLKHDRRDGQNVMLLAMAASYDPDITRFWGLRLPVDPRTAALVEERWARWLAWDPARMAERTDLPWADNLRRLKALFIDCGTEDEYNMLYGARRLHDALHRQGIVHHYEEYADGHSGIDYRLDVSLPWLARALAG